MVGLCWFMMENPKQIAGWWLNYPSILGNLHIYTWWTLYTNLQPGKHHNTEPYLSSRFPDRMIFFPQLLYKVYKPH